MMLSTENIDKLIIGRIDPHIYAFTTNTVPNYLKVGDTSRPVTIRLDEWREIFPNLLHAEDWEWIAKTKNGKYFRDFAVHYYLEEVKKFHRLQRDDIPGLPYYSKEFFENASPQDIDEAILDIEHCAAIADSVRYQFYSEERLPIETHYERVESYPLRPNQEEAVNAFVRARENGRRNLLMYAVMRFGKSFTSMCCATAMNAKVVLIVSAKADVCTEWQRTVESHTRFEGYDFLKSDTLLGDQQAISKRLAEDKKVAVFLTLQDLMGEDIKTKHEDLFKQKIDLLIVDETHFGARANEYGRVLRLSQLNASQIKSERKGADDSLDDLEEGLEQIKQFNVDTTLHLSGTPYRILMGSEFKKEDIIAFCQFTDIIDAKEQWDRDHAKDIDNAETNPLTNKPYQEWDNPYYGFPQMIRFAFNPNTSALQLIARLKEDGKTTALNELFRPKSITKATDNSHRLFVHEPEVIDLLRVIDGSAEDENVLSFLDYDKLKEGKMCRHMVFVLPFCASCDAMQALLLKYNDEFKNLNDYNIINIAGVENAFSSTDEIKQKIVELEQQGKKTITLTVNRMLTGSTVREWDTMLFLKDVSSPQEYDQAIFRLQNQYVTSYKDEAGGSIKYDMKPQTLLVDFDPDRMFRMQEQKSKIYNVNTNERGNEELEQRLERELQVSPIIVANKNKLVQVTPANIMDAVRDYSATRTVMTEAEAIPIDLDILQDPTLWTELQDINPIDTTKGIAVKPIEGDGEDYDEPIDGDATGSAGGGSDSKSPKPKDEEQRDKRLSTLFALILFYALLTNDRVKSLREVIESVRDSVDNRRILHNLGIKYNTLIYLRRHINPFVLSDLDYKIQTSNQLLNDETFSAQERLERALHKFGRMSDSEIVTPAKVADDMVALLPEMGTEDRILDIASKQGEFACALYRRYGDAILNNVYSIPTSSVAYEFTRKVYSLLGMPLQNIFSTFTSYDLISENQESYINTLTNMNFCAVIGNPPYQVSDGGARASAKPIYHLFVEKAQKISPKILTMIIPARWYSGGKGLDEFRDSILSDDRVRYLADYFDATDCFPDMDISGGVCYFLWNKNNRGICRVQNIFNDETISSDRKLNTYNSFVRFNRAISILEKVKVNETNSFVSLVSARKPFGIETNADIKSKEGKNTRFIYAYPQNGYVNKSDISQHSDWVDKDKVFISYAYGERGDFPYFVLGKPFIGERGACCSETYLVIGPFDSKTICENVQSYIKTKFFRFLVLLKKNTQHATNKVYQFVPIQDFSEPWTDEKLYAKYNLSKDEINFIESMIRPME